MLDALTSIAYEDDSQVAGVNGYWVDHHEDGAEIEVEGMYLFDMADFEEFDCEVSEERFTFLIPKALSPEKRKEMEAFYRTTVDWYLQLSVRGWDEEDARKVLPIVHKRYRRKGPKMNA